MALPTIALAEHWLNVLPEDWSILRGPVSSLEPKAVVLRGDNPWIEPSAFCHDLQRYAAIAAVPAATPEDGEADLHLIMIELMDNLLDGWMFVSVSQPRVDRSTGQDLLAAKMTLTYANSDQEAS